MLRLRNIRIFVFLCVPLQNVSCTQTMMLKTLPAEADVYVGEKSVGRTPITLDEEILTSARTVQGYRISIKKLGYRDLYLVLPHSHGKVVATATLESEASPLAQDPQAQKITGAETATLRQKAEDNLVRMLEEQMKLFNGESLNLTFIKSMQKEYPELSLPLFLEALYLYKQGDSQKALTLAENALLILPTENDYLALINLIRSSK